jgi:hypothetical protein
MTEATQHIVFSDYGAEILRAALAVAGRDERVIALPDDLRFGPIAPGDVGQRCSWCEAQFGAEGWQDVAAQTQEFWQAALGPGHNHVVWMSRRSVQDYTGFLEWLWRLGDAPCAVIDLTEVKVVHRDDAGRLSRPHFAVCLALLSGAQIIDGKLFDRAQPLAAEARRRERALWQKLREENAPLRVIRARPDADLRTALLFRCRADGECRCRVAQGCARRRPDDGRLLGRHHRQSPRCFPCCAHPRARCRRPASIARRSDAHAV